MTEGSRAAVIWSRPNGAGEPRTRVFVGYVGRDWVGVYFLKAGRFGLIRRARFDRRYREDKS